MAQLLTVCSTMQMLTRVRYRIWSAPDAAGLPRSIKYIKFQNQGQREGTNQYPLNTRAANGCVPNALPTNQGSFYMGYRLAIQVHRNFTRI